MGLVPFQQVLILLSFLVKYRVKRQHILNEVLHYGKICVDSIVRPGKAGKTDEIQNTDQCI